MVCTKKKFDTKKLATQRKFEINKEEGKRVIKRVYQCEVCGRWHLTSQTRKLYKQNQARHAKRKFYNSIWGQAIIYADKKGWDPGGKY